MTSAMPKHDPIVLARLTGQLGDRETISRRCAALGENFAAFLPDILQREFGFEVAISYAGYEVGRYGQLVSDLGGAMALADCALPQWSDHYAVICDSPLIITLVENMLGAISDSVEEPEPRPLSQIELDVAAMVVDRISSVLPKAVGNTNTPAIGAAHNVESRRSPDDGSEDRFAAMVKMSVGVGPVLSSFFVVVPQGVLLKSAIAAPRQGETTNTRREWSDQLSEQVKRSKVKLEARIRLERQTLETIARLQAGDVIPFHDSGDVRVDVSANGSKLYVCEFGRSGARYTVRVKDTYGSEDELLQHIVG